MNRLLVTGATGFIGRALIAHLSKQREFLVRASSRGNQGVPVAGVDPIVVAPLGPDTSWKSAVSDINTVIHTAARVHVRDDQSADALAEFRHVNVAGTLSLARQAVDAGVHRFVFLSSIKVNGERTERDRPFCADDPAKLEWMSSSFVLRSYTAPASRRTSKP
jgi:nucleoside-diphosphate-sugar epimerase